LIQQLYAGRLDIVMAKRQLGTPHGWREPLVWAAAERLTSSRLGAAAGALSRAVSIASRRFGLEIPLLGLKRLCFENVPESGIDPLQNTSAFSVASAPDQ
jgi:hypothetical protein